MSASTVTDRMSTRCPDASQFGGENIAIALQISRPIHSLRQTHKHNRDKHIFPQHLLARSTETESALAIFGKWKCPTCEAVDFIGEIFSTMHALPCAAKTRAGAKLTSAVDISERVGGGRWWCRCFGCFGDPCMFCTSIRVVFTEYCTSSLDSRAHIHRPCTG